MGDGEGPVGLITYMRTDSVNVAQEAQAEARALIAEQYGPEYRAARAQRLPVAGQERPGGARGHPAHLQPARLPAALRDKLTPRPAPALRADLAALRRQPDGGRHLRHHDGGRRGRAARAGRAPVSASGPAARRSASPVSWWSIPEERRVRRERRASDGGNDAAAAVGRIEAGQRQRARETAARRPAARSWPKQEILPDLAVG